MRCVWLLKQFILVLYEQIHKLSINKHSKRGHFFSESYNDEVILEMKLTWFSCWNTLNNQSRFRNLRLQLLWLRVSGTPPKKSRKGQNRISVRSERTGEKRNIYIYVRLLPPISSENQLVSWNSKAKAAQVVEIKSRWKKHIRINRSERIIEPGAVLAPPSAVPGCLPAANNGSAPLRAPNWDDGWGHLPHSRPGPLTLPACLALKRVHGNSNKW